MPEKLPRLVEVSIMHPLDLVKTRFQIQGNKNDPTRYKNLADCFRQMYRTEGALSFYKFLTFEQYKKLFTSPDIPLPFTFSLAGLGSGFTEGVIICPFEVVKVKLQSQRNVSLGQQQSTWSTAREIINEGGLGKNGIFRGLTATLMRHGVWNCVYFGLYHSMKQRFPAPQDSTSSFFYRFSLGFAAGFLACVANIPFDVAKSRIQGPQPVVDQRKYHTLLATMRIVYVEEGFWALYKGFLPKVMRLAPGGAIMFLVYDAVYDFLKLHV